MAQSPDWVLDQDGDLTLVVGPFPSKTMKVDSKVLCRNSSVFSKMLEGPFVESRTRFRPWEVKLPEDNPQALLIIMDIAHNQWVHAPVKPALNTLCHVLALSNKYDMGKALRPVSHAWLIQTRLEAYMTLKGREARLFVAFELGDADLFARIATRLAIECTVDGSGDILAIDGQSRLIDNEFLQRINIVGETTARRNNDINNARGALVGYILRQARTQQIVGLFLPALDDLGSTWRIQDLLVKLRGILDKLPDRIVARSRLRNENMMNFNTKLPKNFAGSDWHKLYMTTQAKKIQTQGCPGSFLFQAQLVRLANSLF
ncbi:hypothetical protein E4U42_004987 [Claviceps africana]|uniref:BTB domain-containing protein n=1 Tax=Claviceps africana TaxID=83212 RepID=A0A8K0J481_9HYPO|nr:hypothetical protein E4U42_004987 [Claviceps africana]